MTFYQTLCGNVSNQFVQIHLWQFKWSQLALRSCMRLLWSFISIYLKERYLCPFALCESSLETRFTRSKSQAFCCSYCLHGEEMVKNVSQVHLHHSWDIISRNSNSPLCRAVADDTVGKPLGLFAKHEYSASGTASRTSN